ncbi:hypothetical protein GWK47_015718 [Chionoecetes opilio]|uniref:Uncharacterized protein n=1 Tax=Chionoecetes opilio TaxID=41210 RepID=A0A8J4XRV3_CHIOP|nr:hypothetical protein GWK47_015718 [Chionoecetes opilio]
MHSINASWKALMSSWCPRSRHAFWEATNPDRIYGKATQQLCHHTTILLSLPLVPKIPLNPCRIILPDLCQRSPLTFKSTREKNSLKRHCCTEWSTHPSHQTGMVTTAHDPATCVRDTLVDMSEARWRECPHVNYHHVPVSTHFAECL